MVRKRMNMLKDRLRERCLDVYEWVDYRPDADFRWLLAVPVLLALGWAFGSPVGVGIALVLAAIVTVVAAVLGLIAIASWILANALVDIVTSIKLPSRAPTLASIQNDRR